VKKGKGEQLSQRSESPAGTYDTYRCTCTGLVAFDLEAAERIFNSVIISAQSFMNPKVLP
jgi:hypothetical protein